MKKSLKALAMLSLTGAMLVGNSLSAYAESGYSRNSDGWTVVNQGLEMDTSDWMEEKQKWDSSWTNLHPVSLFGQPLVESDNNLNGAKHYFVILSGADVLMPEDFTSNISIQELIGPYAYNAAKDYGFEMKPLSIENITIITNPIDTLYVNDPRGDQIWNSVSIFGYVGYTDKDASGNTDDHMVGVRGCKLPDGVTVDQLPESLKKYVIYAPEYAQGRPTTYWEQDSKGWMVKRTDGSQLKETWYVNPGDGIRYYLKADGYMAANEEYNHTKFGLDGKVVYEDNVFHNTDENKFVHIGNMIDSNAKPFQVEN